MTKNYYIALRFIGRPDIHMTLGYYKNLHPSGLRDLIKRVDDIFAIFRHEPFTLISDSVAYYGPQHSVRALTINHPWAKPAWVTALTEINNPERDKTYGPWVPHITCNDNELILQAEAVAIMQKKMEVASWEL